MNPVAEAAAEEVVVFEDVVMLEVVVVFEVDSVVVAVPGKH